MAPSTTVRCFVALPLPDGVREALAEHLRACAALAPGHRWTPPENLHVTLRFLGRVDVVLLDRLRDALGEVRASPFRVALGGEGRFGRPSAPRVLWLGVREGAAPLAELAGRVAEACRQAGVPGDERPFRSHLTLCRVRRGVPLPDPPPAPELPAWDASEFRLYESRLGRPASVYVPLASWPLR